MLKALLFDLDDTLIDRRATVRAAAADQYRRLFAGAAFTEADYVARFVALDDLGRPPKQQVFEGLLAHFRIESCTWQALLADRDGAVVRCTQLHPGAKACLDGLRADGYKLGLVTNGRFPLQRDKAVAAGLADAFATILVSEAEGLEKPDPALFARALARLDVAPAAAAFVGDDPERDIRGAQAAGMKAVFIPSGEYPECAFADVTVAGLGEVRAAMRRLNPRIRVKDVLEGITLEALLTELIAAYGFPFLGAEIAINCFTVDPSLKSSLTFLRRTPWAREKVEGLYRLHVAGGLRPRL